MISIITPTYNRAYIIDKAYKSLLNQTSKNFEWIVVNDGSKDNTDEVIGSFIKENKIKINYIKKENGGKHTAVNEGVKKAKGSMTLILDSDDYLTEDAIETIEKYEKKYKDKKNICGFSFLKLNHNKEKIGKTANYTEIESNHIEFRFNQNNYGDMSEAYYTKILKNYPFPSFNQEKFLSETIVWNKLALTYNTIYINKGIYICEYINDGLTKNYLKLVYNNPIGASAVSNSMLIKNFNYKIKIKNAILYDGYSILAKQKNIIKNSNNKLLSFIFFPLGYIFKIYLCLKVKKS